MANNMIALQVRPPQSGGLGNIIQQNAQLINMMQQQRAAEAQAAAEAAKAAREKEKGDIDLQGSRLKLTKDFIDASAFGIANARNAEDALKIGQILKQQYNDPAFQASVDQTLASIPTDPAQFGQWRQDALMRTMEASKQLDFMIAKPTTETIIGATGQPAVLTRGGITPPTIAIPKTFKPKPLPNGEVTVEPAETNDTGGTGGPFVPVDQGATEAAPKMAPGVTPSNTVVDLRNMLAGVRNDEEYNTWLTVAGKVAPDFVAQLRQVAPTFNPEIIKKVIDAADAYLANPQEDGSVVAPPTVAPPVVGQADFPLVEGPRGGPYEGYVEAAPFKAKNPSVAPYPGSAQVPLPRVAAEARAGRESPAEVYAKEAARLKAQREAAENAGPKPLTAQQEQRLKANMAKDNASAQAIVDNMIDPKIGVIAAIQRLRKLSPDQKEWLVGYTNYLPSITDAGKRADSLWSDLVGKVTQMGKSAASSSGAIGNMAVQEWQIVQRMIADLDLTKMDVRTFDEKLATIEATARAAADRARRIYEDQYADEFARYPGRFQLKVPAAPAANRRQPPRQTKTGVDTKNPLLR